MCRDGFCAIPLLVVSDFRVSYVREMMGLNLERRWKRINEIRSNASRELETIVGRYVPSRTDSNGNFRSGTSISREYLEIQHTLQVNYYKTYKYVGTRRA